MCISIPLNRPDNEQQSRLWKLISASPLNMLLFSVAFQLIVLFLVNVFAQKYWPGSILTGLETHSFNLLNFQFWILPFISYALVMNFYPRMCQQY